MYELFLLAQLNLQPKCNPQYNPVVVCNKRITINRNRSLNYNIKLSDQTAEFKVNRCTYLASDLNKPIVYEEDKKWCNKEKAEYKLV